MPDDHTAPSRLPELFTGGNLALPVICSPMFICSYPKLVLAQCQAGLIGTFPSLNARTLEQLDEWLTSLSDGIKTAEKAAPYGVNLIVHKSNSRIQQDVELMVKHQVPLVITSVGPPNLICEAIHSYGGLVFHDVTNVKHAKKAISCGIDGLILVAAGAGGHAGTANPFALVAEVRAFWDGPIVLAGSISHGHQIRAAQMMGADLAYMGTRFIATHEANAAQRYKEILTEDHLADIVYTPAFSGIPGNYLRTSIVERGLDPENLTPKAAPNMDLASEGHEGVKAWKDIWSAGHGLGTIDEVLSVKDLVTKLIKEYRETPVPNWP